MTDCKEKKAPNWVLDRAKCTIKGAFDALMDRVQEDVKEANRLPVVTDGRTFNVKNGEHGSFSVYAFRGSPSSRDPGEILFFRNSRTITVTKNETDEIQIVPRWCDEKNKCDYLIENESFEVWQISKMALCEMFFGEGGN